MSDQLAFVADGDPGYQGALGRPAQRLRAYASSIDPNLVTVSLTTFGLGGPGLAIRLTREQVENLVDDLIVHLADTN